MKLQLEKLPLVGRIFFALGLLCIAIEHFIFQDFIVGRAPAWPESVSGQQVWAYFTGALFIAIAVSLITGKKARQAAVLMALLVFCWAFLRYIPLLMADTFLSGTWTSAGKAMVFTAGALATAATYPKVLTQNSSRITRFINLDGEFMITGRVCLGLFLVLTGVQHFLYAEFVASLMPDWFPGSAVFWTYFAGVALIAGGVGLFIPKTASLAALMSGIMVFSWVWLIHLPRSLESRSDNIAIFEALAFSGLAFVLTRKSEK